MKHNFYEVLLKWIVGTIKSTGAEILSHGRVNGGFTYLGYSVAKMSHSLERHIIYQRLKSLLKWQEQGGTCLSSEHMGV